MISSWAPCVSTSASEHRQPPLLAITHPAAGKGAKPSTKASRRRLWTKTRVDASTPTLTSTSTTRRCPCTCVELSASVICRLVNGLPSIRCQCRLCGLPNDQGERQCGYTAASYNRRDRDWDAQVSARMLCTICDTHVLEQKQ